MDTKESEDEIYWFARGLDALDDIPVLDFAAGLRRKKADYV
jgi:hypothetical protein